MCDACLMRGVAGRRGRRGMLAAAAAGAVLLGLSALPRGSGRMAISSLALVGR